MLEKTDEMALRDDYVRAMRNVANSVTVVTTDGPAGCHGATVSSFCSVSADPPTILVCLNKEGRTVHALEENGNFCVNVLPEGETEIAKLFAGLVGDLEDDRFANGEWRNSIGIAPCLDDVTAFHCKDVKIVAATSHMICIGQVEAVQRGTKRPLLYLDGNFCKTKSPD
ncbi:MAG: flavin reductase family protein [Pseudomonadota bacterium]